MRSLFLLHFVRRSLLIQLLSVYLLFVIVVLVGGVGVNAVGEQRLRGDVQASDQALAQDVALDTSRQLSDAEKSLVALKDLVIEEASTRTCTPTPDALTKTFQAYKAARSDVDYVYWLDPIGRLCPSRHAGDKVVVGGAFEPPSVVLRALMADKPVFDARRAVGTTFNGSRISARR